MPVLKNARHEKFCQLRAAGATLIAAYEGAGFSPDRGAACRLSANVSIRDRILEIQRAAAQKTEVDIAYVLRGYVDIIQADIADASGERGNAMLALHEVPPELRRAITSVEVEEMKEDGYVIGHTTKVKLADKKGALDSLGKYLKMFVQKHEHDLTKETLEALVAGAGK
jgi:phage terminase small subunit